MSEPATDLQALNEARQKVSYGDYKNSLVEWTLSDEWTHVDREDTKQPRGMVKAFGLILTLNSCEGEINNAR